MAPRAFYARLSTHNAHLLYQQMVHTCAPCWCLQVGSWTHAEQAAAVQQVLESQALGIARACEGALQQVGH